MTNNILFSPFEQFEVNRLIPLHLYGNFDISITNSTVFMLISLGLFLFLYYSVSRAAISGSGSDVKGSSGDFALIPGR